MWPEAVGGLASLGMGVGEGVGVSRPGAGVQPGEELALTGGADDPSFNPVPGLPHAISKNAAEIRTAVRVTKYRTDIQVNVTSAR
jgi:hypothetical protein